MIKINQTEVKITGSENMVMAEVSMLAYYLKEQMTKSGIDEKKVEDRILHAVNEGFKPFEQLKREALEMISKMTVEELIEMMDAYMEGEKEND